MRVVLVGTGVYPIPPTGYGGVERTIAELERALTRAGATVSIVHAVRRQRSLDEYYFARTLPSQLRGRSFDVVHASTPVVGNRLRGSGIPYVYTTHSRHWFRRRGVRERWGYFLERRAVAGARAAIALTDRLRGAMAEALGPRLPADSPVIPIGVDPDRFRPDWGARTGRRVLGVGVVAPLKRWHVAAAALAGSGAELVIAGPLPDAAYADALRRAGPHVTLLGEVSEPRLAELYASSDLLVHPSAVELLAGVVLQALAAGLPVIGADPVVGLLRPGRTGFGLPGPRPEAELVEFFGTSARTLLGDAALRRRMGEAAREDALARFAWPAVAARHLELYERVAAARPPAQPTTTP